MATTVCELRLAFEPPYTDKEKLDARYTQHYNGLQKVLEYNFQANNCELYLLDNTLSDINQIPKNILDLLEKNSVEIILSKTNRYGSVNKGAGDIENLKLIVEKLKKYEWFIHFEPRQLLLSFQFFDNFFQNPRNLFTLNKNPNAPPHFNTGLYACTTSDIIEFANMFDDNTIQQMVSNSISIEYILYSFFHKNQIQYSTLDKMDLLWFNNTEAKHW
jgi:hypothetical protein